MRRVLWCVAGMLLWGLAGAAVAGAPISFADLARHAQFQTVKLSPDGTHLAATAVLDDGQTVLALIDLATMKGTNVRPRAGDGVLDFWWASPKYVAFSGTQKPQDLAELFQRVEVFIAASVGPGAGATPRPH